MKKFIQKLLKILGIKSSYGIEKASFEIIKINDDTYRIDCKKVILDGNTYFIPQYAIHRPAVKNFLKGQLYEPLTHKFVDEYCGQFRGSIIHAGTFFGDMIPSFSSSVNGKVFAFEPVLENFILAKLCIEENDLTNVIIQNSALSDSIGNLKINTIDKRGNHSGGGSTVDDSGLICPAMTIDSLNLEDTVLIQLDVEGHEIFALKGALETISRCRPVVAIEDNEEKCSKFLRGNQYTQMGRIPGLSIWAPGENQVMQDFITKFLEVQ